MRTPAGYRSYQESDLDRVRSIRLCQGLGFTLHEIRQLLHLHASFAQYNGKTVMIPSAVKEIVEMANERLTVIDDKLKILSSMRTELASLIETLKGESQAVCPVSHE
jgi:MerR family transcriptional regulator, copper efflux regulator